jgi:nitrogen fixation/metabolism regulation signal transduction histidine kinase
MTLRARLIVALLAMALLPTAAFTVFTLDQLGRSTERWFRPGVDHALESAVETTKTSLTKLESLTRREAVRWAALWPAASDEDGGIQAVRDELRDGGLDFLMIYRRVGGQWRAEARVPPTGVIVPGWPELGNSLDAALQSDQIVRAPDGALAGVALLDDGRAAVAGVWVPRGFYEDVDRVVQGMSFYRRLGVVVDVQRQYVWLLVGGLGLALAALAIGIATRLAREMSQPLRDLSGALERVAGGDLAVRLAPRGADELRRLGESFNTMTARLDEARGALRAAEREAAWREVARRLAHEFKNILTPMALSLHRLTRRAEAVPEGERGAVRESLGALSRGVEQMTRLSEQFSQYARLPDPRFETLDLAELARAAAALHEPETARVTVVDDGRLPVRGDTLLLSRAIHNLLINACEASPRGGDVELVTHADGADAVLEVRDRGTGVPAALKEHLFEPYVSTKKRGSGLGLALVRDIAVQHGGRAALEDRDGGGAVARLVLPRLSSEENANS